MNTLRKLNNQFVKHYKIIAFDTIIEEIKASKDQASFKVSCAKQASPPRKCCLLFSVYVLYPFLDENPLKFDNSYCLKLVEECVLHTSNEKKILFGPNCEKFKNVFVRLSENQNEISDADFSVDCHDDYLTENDKQPSFFKRSSNVWVCKYA